MTTPLPRDLFPRVKHLLMPHVTTVEARDALLTEAFYHPLRHPDDLPDFQWQRGQCALVP